jgi:hypothetical protein
MHVCIHGCLFVKRDYRVPCGQPKGVFFCQWVQEPHSSYLYVYVEYIYGTYFHILWCCKMHICMYVIFAFTYYQVWCFRSHACMYVCLYEYAHKQKAIHIHTSSLCAETCSASYNRLSIAAMYECRKEKEEAMWR